MEHVTVFLEEGIKGLNIKPDGIYVDATLGGGGHSQLILKQLTTGHLYSFDQDRFAIEMAEKKLQAISSNYTIINANFVALKEELAKYNVSKIDGIIYDLGVSSFQFDDSERGFSYRFDARLDMRMNREQELDAYYVINNYSEEQLRDIFYRYGEEPFSAKIAKAIVLERNKKPIETTFELVEVIKKALPQKVLNKKGHPAKQVFQALRICVNDELRVFELSLKEAIKMLNVDGRVVIITFHSLEDRIAKHVLKDYSEIKIPKGIPIAIKDEAPLELITKHPIIPSDSELENNNRSHSAKLRIARKNNENLRN